VTEVEKRAVEDATRKAGAREVYIIEKEDIKLESTFESLEIDSLDVFELVTEIEEEFDIEIEDAENLKSVQDLVAYIEGKVAVK
ncbi:phosphopantetheine-binding protein, partial [Clostridium sp. 1001270J_160509_D11]|uniref:phosphopantetheine-binding protein n=1 Tax=Clostridium sp. 1001270J_160509_D11 TaxID=2787103 RepID=UPI0018AAC590